MYLNVAYCLCQISLEIVSAHIIGTSDQNKPSGEMLYL